MPSAPTMYFVLGLLFVASGVPLLRRRVPRNRWYGFRTRKTLSTDETWYAANAVAGRDMIAAGSVVAACGLVSMALEGTVAPDVLALVDLVVFAAAMVASTVHSFSAIKRL
jgi:hypothetical protein